MTRLWGWSVAFPAPVSPRDARDTADAVEALQSGRVWHATPQQLTRLREIAAARQERQ